MWRPTLLVAIAWTAGCQSQNPFAAIGPPTVPAPGSAQAPPYYPPTTSPPSASKTNPPVVNGRISVSADVEASRPSGSSAIVADPADREPIRVVENPNPPTRTATAPARTAPAKAPAATPPASAPPTNVLPGTKAGGQSGARIRIDPAVAPAGYEQPGTGFVESKPANGQWRAR
jgi:hypothetical protein